METPLGRPITCSQTESGLNLPALSCLTCPRPTRSNKFMLANTVATTKNRASGLGRATAIELNSQGGNIAILDLNEDAGAELVKELGGPSRAKFFAVDVTDTASIAAAVKGTAEWVHETAKPLGGIIPAAGVGNPALVPMSHSHATLRMQVG
jgi:NAD(P)-dependent dehydrogenase (short-subunit alcohol dehydrogenase family)